MLAGNLYMNPWVHKETDLRNSRAVSGRTDVSAELTILDHYEKRDLSTVDRAVVPHDQHDDG